MDRLSIAMKIMRGQKLERDEFEFAVRCDFFELNVDKITLQVLKRAYKSHVAQCYEDKHRHAYLCSNHETKQIDDKGTFCVYGIHLDELNPNFLTWNNINFLIRNFGKKTVSKYLVNVNLEAETVA